MGKTKKDIVKQENKRKLAEEEQRQREIDKKNKLRQKRKEAEKKLKKNAAKEKKKKEEPTVAKPKVDKIGKQLDDATSVLDDLKMKMEESSADHLLGLLEECDDSSWTINNSRSILKQQPISNQQQQPVVASSSENQAQSDSNTTRKKRTRRNTVQPQLIMVLSNNTKRDNTDGSSSSDKKVPVNSTKPIAPISLSSKRTLCLRDALSLKAEGGDVVEVFFKVWDDSSVLLGDHSFSFFHYMDTEDLLMRSFGCPTGQVAITCSLDEMNEPQCEHFVWESVRPVDSDQVSIIHSCGFFITQNRSTLFIRDSNTRSFRARVRCPFVSLVRIFLKYGTIARRETDRVNKGFQTIGEWDFHELAAFSQKNMNNIVKGEREVEDIMSQQPVTFDLFWKHDAVSKWADLAEQEIQRRKNQQDNKDRHLFRLPKGRLSVEDVVGCTNSPVSYWKCAARVLWEETGCKLPSDLKEDLHLLRYEGCIYALFVVEVERLKNTPRTASFLSRKGLKRKRIESVSRKLHHTVRTHIQ